MAHIIYGRVCLACQRVFMPAGGLPLLRLGAAWFITVFYQNSAIFLTLLGNFFPDRSPLNLIKQALSLP